MTRCVSTETVSQAHKLKLWSLSTSQAVGGERTHFSQFPKLDFSHENRVDHVILRNSELALEFQASFVRPRAGDESDLGESGGL